MWERVGRSNWPTGVSFIFFYHKLEICIALYVLIPVMVHQYVMGEDMHSHFLQYVFFNDQPIFKSHLLANNKNKTWRLLASPLKFLRGWYRVTHNKSHVKQLLSLFTFFTMTGSALLSSHAFICFYLSQVYMWSWHVFSKCYPMAAIQNCRHRCTYWLYCLRWAKAMQKNCNNKTQTTTKSKTKPWRQ